jgi:ribose 5-phosphate isomerase B
MRVGIACDHAGFPMKALILEVVLGLGHEIEDLGTYSTESVDYPDYALKLGKMLQNGEIERGILLCGSGVGACIAANKLKGVYAGVCHDLYSAHQAVEHDNMNVLCLGPRIIGSEIARELVIAFLNANFMPEERHVRRTMKIRQIEENQKL